ncbi:hypothetical protein BpHYR1_005037 [Brachionus plicatilis]|uniref:Uncharacterized protein n=1 Tax=Brachionus plicatilis TaxID=10195 RepID=A0A3M7RGK5_BRAPC|nr:hypothetical protein BpHYR1_005037 [Brachionus plicatilis]
MPFSTGCNHCAFPGCDCIWSWVPSWVGLLVLLNGKNYNLFLFLSIKKVHDILSLFDSDSDPHTKKLRNFVVDFENFKIVCYFEINSLHNFLEV